MDKHLRIILKISLFTITTILLAFCIFWLPYMVKIASNSIFKFTYLKLFILLIMVHTLISSFIAIYNAFQLSKSVEGDIFFTDQACKSFNGIILAAGGIIILFITTMVYLTAKQAISKGMYIISIVIVITIFIIASLASAFKIILKKMVQAKEEKARIEKEKKLLL